MKLAATGELSLGLGQSLEQKHVPQTSSELGLWANRTDLHRDQEGVLGNKESGIQAWKPDSQAGGGQGEAQAELYSPLSSEVCSCRPAGEASKTASLAGQKLAGKAKSQDLAWVEDRRMKGELLVIPRAKLVVANQVGILRAQKQLPVQMYFKASRLLFISKLSYLGDCQFNADKQIRNLLGSPPWVLSFRSALISSHSGTFLLPHHHPPAPRPRGWCVQNSRAIKYFLICFQYL